MTYSEENIQKYLHILESYKDIFYDITEINEDYFTNSLKKVSCYNCDNTHFIKDDGLRYCDKCFHSNGHVIVNEITYKDRCCFRQKNIYKRDCHYQNKIEETNEKYNLEMSSDEKFELLLKLQKIDDKVMKKINEKWKRKRLINITYLIKRLLSDYDNSKAKKN